MVVLDVYTTYYNTGMVQTSSQGLTGNTFS